MRNILVATGLFFLVVMRAAISFADGTPMEWRDNLPPIYHNQGGFVEYPAFGGYLTGGLCGIVVGFPVGIAAGAAGWMVDIEHVVTGNKEKVSYSMWWGKETHGAIARGGAQVGSYLIGAPFYIVKKVIYDAPLYIFSPSERPTTPESRPVDQAPVSKGPVGGGGEGTPSLPKDTKEGDR